MKKKKKLLGEEGEMSVEDCIKVLENIKERGKDYPDTYSHFTKEYCEKLAEVEALAIDTVISILQEKESNNLKSKTYKSGNDCTTDSTEESKSPIVPILLGVLVGSIIGNLLALLIKIILVL